MAGALAPPAPAEEPCAKAEEGPLSRLAPPRPKAWDRLRLSRRMLPAWRTVTPAAAAAAGAAAEHSPSDVSLAYNPLTTGRAALANVRAAGGGSSGDGDGDGSAGRSSSGAATSAHKPLAQSFEFAALGRAPGGGGGRRASGGGGAFLRLSTQGAREEGQRRRRAPPHSLS